MTPRLFLARLGSATLALAAMFLSGCWQDRLVWSPDGARAAIITADGLQFCDAEGTLTPLLGPGVYRAAWLGDSQHLVLARVRSIHDYAALTAALGPARTQTLAAEAEIVWQEWLASPKGEFNPRIEPLDDTGAIALYLRDHHGGAFRQKYSENPKNDPKEIDSMSVDWHSLVAASIIGNQLEIGPTLYEGLSFIQDVRPAPRGSAVAFVAQAEHNPVSNGGLCTFVVAIEGSAPPDLVATHTAAHPDWTPDSRILVYFKDSNEHIHSDELQMGALVEREVLDISGHIHLAEKTRELAGLLFQEQSRIRCLRNGRVLFDAAEFHFPIIGGHPSPDSHEQLFAIDRIPGASSLTPLIRNAQLGDTPRSLKAFEISPDEIHVLFNSGTGGVDVLTLASGKVEHMALGLYEDSHKNNPPLPVWRRAGEIVYVKKGSPRNELVLRRNGKDTVLSRSWPDAVLARLIE